MNEAFTGGRFSVAKAAHRRDESSVTATLQGPSRGAKPAATFQVGNQRAAGGAGAGTRAVDRGKGFVPKPRVRGKLAAAGALGAAGAGAAYGHHRHVSKAFGIEVSKDATTVKPKPNAKPTGGRVAAGAGFGWGHAAVAAKKGQKLRAVGSSAGHEFAGNVGGSAIGARVGRAGGQKGVAAGAVVGGVAGAVGGRVRSVYTNSAKGRFKPQGS